MTYKSWLKALEPGDKVIVRSRYGNDPESVKRVTKTQIILSNGTKFRRTTGWKIPSDTWNSSYLFQATPELIARIEEARHRSTLLNKIAPSILKKLPTDQLEQIVKWLDAQKED